MKNMAIASAVALTASVFVLPPPVSSPDLLTGNTLTNTPDTYIVDLFSAPTLGEADDASETSHSTTLELVEPESVTPEETAPEKAPDSTERPTQEERVAATGNEIDYADDVSTHVDVTYSESRITTLSRSFGTAVVPGEESVTTLAAASNVYDLFTAPLAVDEYSVAGVTWSGNWPASVEIRVEIDGEWLEWYSLELEETADGNGATEPYMAAGASGIQVRAQYASAPTNFQVHLETGAGNGGIEEEADVEVADKQPAPASTYEQATNDDANVQPVSLLTSVSDSTVTPASWSVEAPLPETVAVPNLQSALSAPKIVSRSEWGAPAKASWRPKSVKLTGAIIHHTAGSNTYTQAQSAGLVRGIWNYHNSGQGWGDIGYNFLVDKYGTIYEGREGSLTAKPGYMSVGAHAAPANTNSVGISVMGEYTKTLPPEIAIDALNSVIAWQFSMANVNPLGNRTYKTNAGVTKTISTIAGHQQVASTACPGLIQGKLPSIRKDVATKLKGVADQQPNYSLYDITYGEPFVTLTKTVLRKEPSFESQALRTIPANEMATSTGRGAISNGLHWYEVRQGSLTGWVRSSDAVNYANHPSYVRLLDGSVFTVTSAAPMKNVASPQGTTVASLPQGALVETGYHKVGDYWQVRYRGTTAWVLRSALSSSGFRPGSFSINAGNPYVAIASASILNSAQSSASGVRTLSAQEMVVTTGAAFRSTDGIFYEVRQGLFTGWMSANDLVFYSKAPSYVRLNDGAYFSTLTSTPLLTLASQRGERLTSIPKGVNVETGYHKVGDYWQVRYSGKTGWVLRSNLSASGLKPAPYEINAGNAYVTLHVTSMHTGADSNSTVLRQLPATDMIVTTGRAFRNLDGHWYEVRQGYVTGWMRASELSFYNKHKSYVALNPGVTRTIASTTTLRTLASQHGETVLSLYPGQRVVTGNHKIGSYWQVRVNGKTGWVLRSAIVTE